MKSLGATTAPADFAHIGWLLVTVNPSRPLDNVADLWKDPLAQWQHRHVNLLAVPVGFVLPTLIAWAWGGSAGALGEFLLAGVTRVVCVQHTTFFINSLCRTSGTRPYYVQPGIAG